MFGGSYEPVHAHADGQFVCPLCRYPKTLEENAALIANEATPPRQRMACRLVVTEEKILQGAMDRLMRHPCAPATPAAAKCTVPGIKLT